MITAKRSGCAGKAFTQSIVKNRKEMKLKIPNEIKIALEGMLVTGTGIKRKIKCHYCGQVVNRSILPHLRRKHQRKWDQWCQNFVRLYQNGYSLSQIMRMHNTLFTWKIIDKEIKRMVEERGLKLNVSVEKNVRIWEPDDFELERTTLWLFEKRGDWAVHKGNYRGNWTPEIPRNIILQFTEERDTILDPFVGGGTTLIECGLLNRKGIGVDISPLAIAFTKQRLKEMEKISNDSKKPFSRDLTVRRGDARRMGFIEDSSIDLICTQPPYANALRFTYNIENDLSRIKSVSNFLDEMQKVAKELHRVLRREKVCAVLIGDIRKKGNFVPLGFKSLDRFIKVGFKLEDIIIKGQYNDGSTRFYSTRASSLRYRIRHEYLLILRKT